MKRNIYSLLIGIGLVLSLPACKDFLNTEPSDAIPTDKVASDISLLPPALRGLYDELQGSNSSTAYYARGFIIAGDVMGDDMQGLPAGSRVQS